MKICIITHYYPPEIGAPQARLSEMAKYWVKKGHEVNVVTCFPNHPTGVIPNEYKNKRYLEEIIDGVHITRCWVYATPNKGFIKKILGHFSFMCTAILQGRKKAKYSNIIIVSSPTLFSVISAYLISLIYKIPFVFEVRDLWPAIFVELGILKNKLIIKVLEAIELFLYKKALAIVPVTHAFADNIVKRGIDPCKVFVITNGVDLEKFKPQERNTSLLKRLNLQDKFIVLYIGAHGISHALEKIIEVADRLKNKKEIHFLFVGEGAAKEKIQKYTKQLNLTNVTFLSGQKKEDVPTFYASADAVLVPLKKVPLFKTFIPSKMFEIMAMAKPIMASLEGEAADILKKSKSALISPPENVEHIIKHVLTLFENTKLKKELAVNGRGFVEKYYNRNQLASEYLKQINDRLNKLK